jgi:hypothetical protein
MLKTHKIDTLLILFCLIGCATKLDPGAEKVRTAKSDPPSNCEELGTVRGNADPLIGGEPTGIIQMRKAALEKGGNYVRMEGYQNSVTVFGTVYKCPDSK